MVPQRAPVSLRATSAELRSAPRAVCGLQCLWALCLGTSEGQVYLYMGVMFILQKKQSCPTWSLPSGLYSLGRKKGKTCFLSLRHQPNAASSRKPSWSLHSCSVPGE